MSPNGASLLPVAMTPVWKHPTGSTLTAPLEHMRALRGGPGPMEPPWSSGEPGILQGGAADQEKAGSRAVHRKKKRGPVHCEAARGTNLLPRSRSER